MATFDRRSFLALAAAAWSTSRARPLLADASKATSSTPAPDLEVRDYTVAGDPVLGSRFVLCVPTHLAKDEKVPLLVALHGLGETVDLRTGAYAFVEHYGLLEAYARLRYPPVTRTLQGLDYFGDAGLAELNASLAAKPFRGLAIACPYMPNFIQLDRNPGALDRYASWITETVVPTSRREAPVYTDTSHTSLAGVSLGGYTSLEVFLRKPEVFGAWGSVQGALGSARVAGYAEKLAAVCAKSATSPRNLLLETSKGDPFRETTLRLADALTKKGVHHDVLVYPGPHDQPWLRESGTLAMLRWHDARG
jgi:acetyl esterase/lipase